MLYISDPVTVPRLRPFLSQASRFTSGQNLSCLHTTGLAMLDCDVGDYSKSVGMKELCIRQSGANIFKPEPPVPSGNLLPPFQLYPLSRPWAFFTISNGQAINLPHSTSSISPPTSAKVLSTSKTSCRPQSPIYQSLRNA